MKCYNHPDRDSVATCQKCGKFLCKECADNHQPFLCDDCYNKLRQKEIDDLISAKKKFKKTLAMSSVLAIICLIITLATDIYFFPLYISLIAFFLPWGWKYSNLLGWSWFFNLNPSGIVLMLLYYILKAIIAAIVGVFCFFAALNRYRKIQKVARTDEIEMPI